MVETIALTWSGAWGGRGNDGASKESEAFYGIEPKTSSVETKPSPTIFNESDNSSRMDCLLLEAPPANAALAT
jgi:hypothetical protein